MVPSQERIQHLIQKLSAYYVLYQTCADRIRYLCLTQVLYDEAYKKWQSDPTNPLFEPPRNDNHKKAQYFAKCDEICGMDVKTVEDYFTIGFACWAGIQVITGQEFDGLANKNEIWKAATDLASKEYLSKNPEVRRRIESRDQILSAIYPSRAGSKTTRSEVTILPDSPDADDPELLSDLLSACCVSGDTAETSLAGSTTTPRELGPHLIDKTVRYHDQETGKIMELTIQDCGTSHLKGEWFEVEYDDLTVLQITAGELKEILANRVDQ